MTELCSSCAAIPDPAEDWSAIKIQPSLAHLQRSAQDGCPLCTLFTQARYTDTLDVYTDVPMRLKSGFPIGTICVRRERATPEPWYVVEIRDGPSYVVGEALVFAAGKLNLFPPPETRALPHGEQAESAELDASQVIRERCSRWLRTCLREHPECRHVMEPRFVPTRLVKISVAESGDLCASLVEAQGLSPPPAYLALSYRWPQINAGMNGDMIEKLTTANTKDLTGGVPSSHLLHVYGDALKVAQLLGHQYIWIDALCILQDSKEDWAKEALTMSQIYSSAEFTLSLDEPDQSYGFPLRRKLTPSTAIEFKWDSGSRWVISRPKYFDNVITRGALSSRGWIFQERMFSRRVINFTRKEVFWQCDTSAHSESGTYCGPTEVGSPDILEAMRPIVRSLKPMGPRDAKNQAYTMIYGFWIHLVTEYTARSFTYHSDKLPALSSTALALSKILSEEYLAGAWAGSLEKHLAWFTSLDPKVVQQPIRPKEGAAAPSWSWASVASPVKFLLGAESSPSGRFPDWFQGHKPDYSSGNIFGSLTSHHLIVRGRLVIAFRDDGPVDMTTTSKARKDGFKYSDIYETYSKFFSFQSQVFNLRVGNVIFDTHERPKEFLVLWLSKDLAFAVKKHDDSENQFSRIGILHVSFPKKLEPPEGYQFTFLNTPGKSKQQERSTSEIFLDNYVPKTYILA